MCTDDQTIFVESNMENKLGAKNAELIISRYLRTRPEMTQSVELHVAKY